MKKLFFFILTLPFLFIAVSCVAKNDPPATETGTPSTPPSSDEVTDKTTEPPKTTPLAVSKPIHSIYDLNLEYTEGSHSDLYAFSHLERDLRSENEIGFYTTKTNTPYYTRVKQLKDGSFFIVYNDQKNKYDINIIKSKDGVNWSQKEIVFKADDKKTYAGPDAIQLENGDILVFTQWRLSDYYTNPSHCGIAVKRSTDNGETWGEEKTVFLGCNWEPYMLQLKSGEIQLYWTNTTCYVLKSCNNTSTGSAILRSFDNGYTWTGDPTKTYTGQVISKQATEIIDGVQFYTDQMPVAIELLNGEIVVALESRLNTDGVCKITLSYTNDNWAAPSIPDNETGPADKQTNIFSGAGPYILQFPSGETLLRFTSSAKNKFYIGNAAARTFQSSFVEISERGGWGNIELLSDKHTVMACSTVIYNRNEKNEKRAVITDNLVLNHVLFSKSAKDIVIDGLSDDWASNTDALFVGSETQAQASFRFARDDDRLCILMERLDRDITPEDVTQVRIALPNTTLSYINVEAYADGSVVAYSLIDGVKTDIEGVKSAVKVYDTKDDEGGYVAEIEIPASAVPQDIRVIPVVINKDSTGSSKTDYPLSMNRTNNSDWIPVYFN